MDIATALGLPSGVGVVVPPEKATDRTPPPRPGASRESGPADPGEPEDPGLAAAALRQARQGLPEIAELSSNVVITKTEAGLDRSIVDQGGRAMFPDGSSRPTERTRRLLETLAPALRRLPDRIAITGFTASGRPGRRPASATTASPRWRARPTPSRCSPTTPTSRPTAG